MRLRAALRRALLVLLTALLAIPTGVIAAPTAAAVRAGDTSSGSTPLVVAYAYDVPAPLSPSDTGATGAAGSSSGPRVVSAVRSASVRDRGVAANTAADVPLIKPGAAGGETAGRVFPQSVRQQALAENPSTCVYCRMETQTPQVDHVIPRSTGGNATLQNAQTTCPWCNASKGAREFPVNPPPGYRGAWPPEWWGVPE